MGLEEVLSELMEVKRYMEYDNHEIAESQVRGLVSRLEYILYSKGKRPMSNNELDKWLHAQQ